MAPVAADAVSLEHISPLVAYHMQSAPRNFRVWGRAEAEDEPMRLGEFEYSIEGAQVQTFALEESEEEVRLVTFEFQKNWGHEEYTCVYRVRVHGEATE